MLRWLWLTTAVIVLDQVTKQIAQAALIPYEPIPIAPSFNLSLMYNTGAAFSILADAGGWQRWFFVVLSATVSCFLVAWMSRLHRNERLLAIALALILGGAIGNLIDRIFFGYVIDFIQVYYASWYWPAFNIADSAITVGATLLVVSTFVAPRAGRSKNPV
jgi:signal peptidase II